MKNKILLILLLFIIVQNGYTQSLATNILFEQANIVYKGVVEKISYNYSGEAGSYYGITTRVEEVYKNYFYEERVHFEVTKPDFCDLESSPMGLSCDFQLTQDSTYVFFIRKGKRNKNINGQVVYWTTLVNRYIGGIPFSNDLKDALQLLDEFSYLNSNNYGSLPLKILNQSSPVSAIGIVNKIEKIIEGNHYFLSVTSESIGDFTIKTKGLNCICEEGEMMLNQKYLFFLTPYDKEKYLLTDRWLGVFKAF